MISDMQTKLEVLFLVLVITGAFIVGTKYATPTGNVAFECDCTVEEEALMVCAELLVKGYAPLDPSSREL